MVLKKSCCLISLTTTPSFPVFFLFPPFSLSNFDSDPGATTGVRPASQQILKSGWQGPGGGACPCAIHSASRSVSRSLWLPPRPSLIKGSFLLHVQWLAWRKSTIVSSELSNYGRIFYYRLTLSSLRIVLFCTKLVTVLIYNRGY